MKQLIRSPISWSKSFTIITKKVHSQSLMTYVFPLNIGFTCTSFQVPKNSGIQNTPSKQEKTFICLQIYFKRNKFRGQFMSQSILNFRHLLKNLILYLATTCLLWGWKESWWINTQKWFVEITQKLLKLVLALFLCPLWIQISYLTLGLLISKSAITTLTSPWLAWRIQYRLLFPLTTSDWV